MKIISYLLLFTFVFGGCGTNSGDNDAADSDSNSHTDTDIDSDTDVDSDMDVDSDTDECVPNCTGHQCGDNNCGGSCGTCGEGAVCTDGMCVQADCPAECQMDCPQGCFDFGACMESHGELTIHPNIETVGILLTPGEPVESAELYYRQSGVGTWHRGPDAVLIPSGQLATSLFHTQPSSTYEIMMRTSSNTTCGTTTTLPVIPAHTTGNTLYVDADAPAGGNGEEQTPFTTIMEAVSNASAGTDIVVRPGIYREEVSISGSGSQGQYIRFLGEPGAILDGSNKTASDNGLQWTAVGNNIYSTPWFGTPSYMARNQERFYHYTSLNGLYQGLGDDNIPIDEGWYINEGLLYVRCTDAPENHTWQLPDLTAAFGLDGASWIWIEGFTIRFFGESEYPKGIDIRKSSHVVVSNNHIHDTSAPIWVRKDSEYVQIYGNKIHQSAVHTWPWAAVKGTDHENTAIQLGGGTGNIVFENVIYNIFNGVASGSFSDDTNPQIAFDVDVYRNRMRNVTDDGLEPEGACINNRFRANTIDSVHNGISLAPITWGPVWVIGNRFTDYDESGFKVSNNSSGSVFLYHNTCWTDRTDQNGMGVSGYFENMTFRNNIVRGTRYALEMSIEVGSNDLDYDNFYTPRGEPIIKWNNERYDSVSLWCESTGLECNGHDHAPGISPLENVFTLTDSSANIDAGVRIYGINDAYTKLGPDLGYLELGTSEVPVLSF